MKTGTAIILAAGMGSRLDPNRRAAPAEAEPFSKPLMDLGGQTLLERTIVACRLAGADRILVVTGFRGDLVAREAARLSQGDVETIHNPDWHKANGLSLLACRDAVRGDFVLMMADHVFEPSILADLMAAEVPAGSVTLAVDFKLDSIFDMDDATKVRVDHGRIIAIGKQLERPDAIDCGLFRCSTAIFDALAEVHARRGDAQLSEGMAILGERGQFLPFDIGDRWWQDVDTPEMLDEALRLLSRRGR